MAEIPEAYVYDALRTPRGRGKASGSLYEVKPVSLVVGLIDEVRARHPELDTSQIDDVVLGVVSPIGDQGGDIAKTAAIAAGLPDTVAGVQLNRFCASGLEAVNTAALKVRSGMEELVLAGGVEAMSRVPMGSDGGAWAMDPDTSYTTGFVPQGIGADLIATLEGFTREDVDTFAVESQTRAAKAWANGYFAKSVVPVKDRNGLPILDRDEHIRAGATLESLAGLQPSFAMMGEAGGFDAVALQRYHWVEKIEHVHHAGNSSGIVDGAALVLVGSEAAGAACGLTPRARILATALSGADPTIMLTGPAPASRKALAKAGLTVDDIDLFEINEAFAAVAMRYMKDMGISHEQTNVNGGAIAMGHPLGATGAMILGTLIDELERRDLRRGLATLCVGGGMGIATIVERGLMAVTWEKDDDGIAIVTLDDPGRSANTMNDRYLAAMGAVVDELVAAKDEHRRRDRHVGQEDVLRGRRPRRPLEGGPGRRGRRCWPTVTEVKAQLRKLETLGKPVVAAMNGTALGGGLEIGLACHHRIGLDAPRRGVRAARGHAGPAARRRGRHPRHPHARDHERVPQRPVAGPAAESREGRRGGDRRRAGLVARGDARQGTGVDRGATRTPNSPGTSRSTRSPAARRRRPRSRRCCPRSRPTCARRSRAPRCPPRATSSPRRSRAPRSTSTPRCASRAATSSSWCAARSRRT